MSEAAEQSELPLDRAQEEQEYEKLFAQQNKGNRDQSAAIEDDDEGTSKSEATAPDNEDRDDGDGTASPSSGTKEPAAPKQPPKFMDEIKSWIDELPDEFRDKAEALYRSERSSSGRLAAYQRQVEELQARVSAREQLKREADSKKSASTEPEETSLEELKQFQEKYPALAKSVQALINQKERELEEKFNERINPIREDILVKQRQEAARRFEQEASELLDTPNSNIHYTQVTASKPYKEWLAEQPQQVRDMARTTQDPKEAIWILRSFVNHARSLMPEPSQEGGGPSRADRTKAQRERAKQSAGTPRNNTPPMTPGEAVEGDYEKLFVQMNKHTLPSNQRRN